MGEGFRVDHQVFRNTIRHDQMHKELGSRAVHQLHQGMQTNQMLRSKLQQGGHQGGRFCSKQQSGECLVLMLYQERILFVAEGLRPHQREG